MPQPWGVWARAENRPLTQQRRWCSGAGNLRRRAGSQIHPHERCPRRRDGSPGWWRGPPSSWPLREGGTQQFNRRRQARSERSQQRESLLPLAVDFSGSGSLISMAPPFTSLIQHTFSEGLAGPSLVLSLGRLR